MTGLLLGRVCVVTGASRGIGRGVALQLAEAGATVYITGRQLQTLKATATEVETRGGKCIPVVCDSSKESDIKSLFERVSKEQNGRLDILVNNAFSAVKSIFENRDKKFWETDTEIWDDVNNVGLRGHYICSVYAAQAMVKAGQGIIVIISSMGGLQYIFNVPYGVGKAACDRLAADCAVELRSRGVSYVSLWPGTVQTETLRETFLDRQDLSPQDQLMADLISDGESPELTGKCIVALANDKNILNYSGKVLFTCDLASRYNLKDIDGRGIVHYRSLKFLVKHIPGLSWLSPLIPSFFRVPKWVLALAASKF